MHCGDGRTMHRCARPSWHANSARDMNGLARCYRYKCCMTEANMLRPSTPSMVPLRARSHPCRMQFGNFDDACGASTRFRHTDARCSLSLGRPFHAELGAIVRIMRILAVGTKRTNESETCESSDRQISVGPRLSASGLTLCHCHFPSPAIGPGAASMTASKVQSSFVQLCPPATARPYAKLSIRPTCFHWASGRFRSKPAVGMTAFCVARTATTASRSIRFSRQRPFTIDKFNQPLTDGNGVLTCRSHAVEPTTAMADLGKEPAPTDTAKNNVTPINSMGVCHGKYSRP
jgi:hypothetical protein